MIRHVGPVASTATVILRAQVKGRQVYVVPPAASKAQLLAGIATALHFPDYFGHNLDALYEFLSDLSWLPPGPKTIVWDAALSFMRADRATYGSVGSIFDVTSRDAADGIEIVLCMR